MVWSWWYRWIYFGNDPLMYLLLGSIAADSVIKESTQSTRTRKNERTFQWTYDAISVYKTEAAAITIGERPRMSWIGRNLGSFNRQGDGWCLKLMHSLTVNMYSVEWVDTECITAKNFQLKNSHIKPHPNAIQLNIKLTKERQRCALCLRLC